METENNNELETWITSKLVKHGPDITNWTEDRVYQTNFEDYTYTAKDSIVPEIKPPKETALLVQIKWAEKLLSTPLLPNEYLTKRQLKILREIVDKGTYRPSNKAELNRMLKKYKL